MAFKTFLFCLPVRLGVLLLSLLGLAAYGLIAFGVFFQLRRLNNPAKIILIPAIIFGVASAISALSSLVGFIGAVFARRGLVKFYSRMLIWVFLFNTGVGIFYIVFLFTKKSQIENDCLQELVGVNNANKICTDVASTNRWIFLGAFLASVVIELYLLAIVRRYAAQLEETSYKYIRRSQATSLLGNQAGSRSVNDSGPLQPYNPIFNPSRQSLGEKEEVELGHGYDGPSPYKTPYQTPYDSSTTRLASQ